MDIIKAFFKSVLGIVFVGILIFVIVVSFSALGEHAPNEEIKEDMEKTQSSLVNGLLLYLAIPSGLGVMIILYFVNEFKR